MAKQAELVSVPVDFITKLRETYHSEWKEAAEILQFLNLLGVRGYSLSGTQDEPIIQVLVPTAD